MFSAGCAAEPSAPTPNVGDGGCLEDPVGRSRPPADCPRDIPSKDDCATAVPSFERDVGPILAARCKLCHAPGQTAEHILFDTYGEAFHWYKLMYTQVFGCTMPPSCSGRLADTERNVLLKWFVCGAPTGPARPDDGGTGDVSTGDVSDTGEVDDAGDVVDVGDAAGEPFDGEDR
jgi:hypothetical protein